MYGLLFFAFILPLLSSPMIYLAGKRSVKISAAILSIVSLLVLSFFLFVIPKVSYERKYVESYSWISNINSSLTLFVDGVSLPIVIVTMLLFTSAVLFSVDYMRGSHALPGYYTLLTLLMIGLIGFFITSDLLVFYFCLEFMLLPTFFIIGEWGYRNSYRTALKFFLFTHAGVIPILLGIGCIFMLTGTFDMFQARSILAHSPQSLLVWILLAFTLGFIVKMGIVPVHMWLPDAYAEAPAPISALLSGIITEAGAYGMLRIPFSIILPSITNPQIHSEFLYVLSILGVTSAFYGAIVALAQNDLKRIAAYSSISHMGYILYGLSLFPIAEGMVGTIFHMITHGVSKGLLFLTAGAIMRRTNTRNIGMMGGLASMMPLTAISTAISCFSIAGIPAFACFISEFLILLGGFEDGAINSFYYGTTSLMIVITVISAAYVLRLFGKVFFGSPKIQGIREASIMMAVSMLLLSISTVILGVWPGPIVKLINTAIKMEIINIC